jgi:hypothetical protein
MCMPEVCALLPDQALRVHAGEGGALLPDQALRGYAGGCVLLPDQAAWQSLLDHSGDGAVLDDSGDGKASVVGAVLTSRRLMMVSATLRVIAATPLSSSQPPITSFLWAGPALLFCNAAHQARTAPFTTQLH